MKVYCSQAVVNVKSNSGGTIVQQIPTFYLFPSVQGIISVEHAEKIVERICNPTDDPNVTVHANVCLVDVVPSFEEPTTPIPTISRSGTHPDSLIDDVCEATFALDKAIKALSQTAPHGRDYTPEQFKVATECHQLRRDRLEEVREQFNALALGISNQKE